MGVENFITNECDATHDFEPVPIKTADNQDCVMGEILELSRRSSSVVCNPGKSMPGPTRSPCICSKSDIQCADCFYWDREQERCDYGGNCRNREHLTAVPYNCAHTINITTTLPISGLTMCGFQARRLTNSSQVMRRQPSLLLALVVFLWVQHQNPLQTLHALRHTL
jgi:hypothetical protein